MVEVILLGVAAVVWAVLVWFFWRSGAWLPYYLVGSAGSAILIVFGCRELPVQAWLQASTAHAVQFTSAFIGVQTTTRHLPAGDLLVVGFSHGHQWTNMTIGLECSGLLEGAALCGLVAFFPAYTMKRRALIMGIALAATFVANIIRVMVIVGVVAYIGQAWLQFAHVVLGRMVFFALAIGIYWFAVTRPTLRTVGSRLRGPA